MWRCLLLCVPPFQAARECQAYTNNVSHYSGASLSSARSFCPAVSIPYFSKYHYIYWFCLIMGSLLLGGHYKFLKHLNYKRLTRGKRLLTSVRRLGERIPQLSKVPLYAAFVKEGGIGRDCWSLPCDYRRRYESLEAGLCTCNADHVYYRSALSSHPVHRMLLLGGP